MTHERIDVRYSDREKKLSVLVCRCGYETTPTGDYEASNDEFYRHVDEQSRLGRISGKHTKGLMLASGDSLRCIESNPGCEANLHIGWCDGREPDENESNAERYSRAWNALEPLTESLSELLTFMRREYPSAGQRGNWPTITPMIQRAEAALAKATEIK